MRKKVLFFTGAGISAESGIQTFRGGVDSMWENESVEDVATIGGWRKDKKRVLDFYNKRRRDLFSVEPNNAHRLIAKLEKDFDVYVVTQNVDDLHERAGSTDVIHLHGELLKSRSTLDPSLVYDQVDDIKINDKCIKGSQLRPNIIWFGEMLDEDLLERANRLASECDYCVIVGTSLLVYPASHIPNRVRGEVSVFYVDPSECHDSNFEHIQENATTGVERVINLIYEYEL